MVAPINQGNIKAIMLKPIDVAEAVLYALGAPQRVNVSLPMQNICNLNLFY